MKKDAGAILKLLVVCFLILSVAGSAQATPMLSGNVPLDSYVYDHLSKLDGLGLLRALEQQAPNLVLKGSPVVMLGAGGAARAAAATLAGAGAQVRIVNRTRDRAEALAAGLRLQLLTGLDFGAVRLVP